MSIHELRTAEAPNKANLLKLLDELRADVESGKTLGLVAIPIYTDREFETRFVGEQSYLHMVGLMEFAKKDFMGEIDK